MKNFTLLAKKLRGFHSFFNSELHSKMQTSVSHGKSFCRFVKVRFNEN